MTDKELNYMEDAINHEKSIIDILNISIDNIDNSDLEAFLKEEVNKHTTLRDDLLNVLEVKSNDH